MKVSKRQLRNLIKEERAKLLIERQIGGMVGMKPLNARPTNEQAGSPATGRVVPVDGETIGQMPSELEEQLAMEMQYYFQEAIEAEEYDGTGPTWEKEIMNASNEFYRGIIDSGALKSILELWRDVEDGLHNGDYL